MYIKNLGEIEAIAFDIDGTLYPQNSIYWRAIFHYIIHNYFFLHYGIVRYATDQVAGGGPKPVSAPLDYSSC